MLTKLKNVYVADKKPARVVTWADKSHIYTWVGAALFKEDNKSKKAVPLSYTPDDAAYKATADRVKQVIDEGKAFVAVKEDLDLQKAFRYISTESEVFEYLPKVKETYPVPLGVKSPLIRLYQVPEDVLNLKADEIKTSLCVSFGGSLAIKLVDTKTEMEAIICMKHSSVPEELTWEFKGITYKPTAWDNTSLSYKQIVKQKPTKETIMAQKTLDFSELDNKQKAGFEDTLAKAKEEASQVEAGAKDKMAEILEEAKNKMAKARAASDSKETVKEEPKTEMKANTPSTEPEMQETAKLTRKRAPKTQLRDLQAIIDRIEIDVDKDLSIEEAIEEKCQLSGLLLSVTNRIIKIDEVIKDKANSVSAKLKQLKSLLG